VVRIWVGGRPTWFVLCFHTWAEVHRTGEKPAPDEGIRASVSTLDVWGKADIHIHSNQSDGLASVYEIMNYVADHTDLSVIAITDHNTLEGARVAASIADMYDFEVVVGEEVSSSQGHIIGLYLEEEIAPGMSAADTVQAIEEQGGIAVIAHPFSMKGVFGPRGRSLFTAAASDWAFHAFEVYNSLPFLVWANSMAAKTLAGGQGVAATGGSDAHVLEAVGKGYTLFRGTSAEDLRASIMNLETRAAASPQGVSLAWRYALNFMNIRRQQAWNAERCGVRHD
jgi:predicted metal-dependent phosphoesterase TrpH